MHRKKGRPAPAGSSAAESSAEPTYPPIRLTRATAFRSAKISQKHEDQRNGTYVELDMDSLNPRLNNSHQLQLLGRVTAAVGERFEPIGHSVSDKLASVRCDPAGKLLSKTSWREFFRISEGQGVDMEEEPRGRGRERRESSPHQEFHHQQPHSTSGSSGSAAFSAMIARVELLWHDVRMSREDKSFYRKTLCRAPAQSAEQHLEVARYISVLQEHRMATIRTMQAIELREGALRRCCDVLAAMKRKSAHIHLQQHQQQQQQLGLTDTNFVSSNTVRNATARDDLAWKEELACCLKDLQLSSLEVIRRIQLWRRNLWRPRPFLWRGNVDYLYKMRGDMNVITSPVFVRCLDSIPLQLRDLECVLYDTPPDQDLNQGQGQERGKFFATSDEGLEDTPLRKAFLVGVHWPELRAAAQVVRAHDVLMAALQDENAKLVEAGVFIPTLKLFPQQQQQQQQAVSEPTPPRARSPGSPYQNDFEPISEA